MAERRVRTDKSPDDLLLGAVPRARTAAEIKQMVKDVIRMGREEAERRRKLGIPDPEAPGLTPEARGHLYKS